MGNIGTSPGGILAGLSADLFHKVQSGAITLHEMTLFLQRKNPFEIERNQHGHILLRIIGDERLGIEEIAWLSAQDYKTSDCVRECLTSNRLDGYDTSHRLKNGVVYVIALIPDEEFFAAGSDHSNECLLQYGQKFGYTKPRAGIIPRLREIFSSAHMNKLGWFHISIPHDRIMLRDDFPCEWYVTNHRSIEHQRSGGRWFSPNGAFALMVPDPS